MNQALALRKEVRDQWDTTLIAAMERAFDKAGAPDEILRIPMIRVQVRISGMDELAGELPRCIEQELRRLRSMMATPPGQARLAFQTGPSDAESAGRADFAGLTPAGSETTPSLQARIRMLLHYLETGSLPWPLAQVGPAVAVSELQDVADSDPPRVIEHLTREPESLPARVAFWFRWLQLLPDSRWPDLTQAAIPPSSEQGARLAEIIGVLSGEHAGALSRYARLQLAAAAIVMARGTGELTDAGEFASIVLQVLGGGGAESAGRIASSAASATSGSGYRARSSGGPETHVFGSGDASSEAGRTILAGRMAADALGEGGAGEPGDVAWTERIAGSAASATSGSSSHTRPFSGADSDVFRSGDGASGNDRTSSLIRLPEPAAAAFRAWLASPSGPPHSDAPEPFAGVEIAATRTGMAHGGPAEPRPGQPIPQGSPLQPRPEPGLVALSEGAGAARSRNTGARPAPFGQMVHHAGLVLLHPFLARFFESTAIKEADEPELASGVLPRAAALLHLLAAGEGEIFEFELDFIKVLLGLPLDSPLPVSEGLLLASDREEVEALLSAVVGHWSVLKSTSVQGLRSSFLQRPGLLREEEQGFRLQVEPAPFDMLLGQLPWGFGTVKLPWMRKAIFTEWLSP